MAEIRPSHVDAITCALAGDFCVDADTIRDAIKRRASFNVIHPATMFKADITIRFASPEGTLLHELIRYQLSSEVSDRQWGDVLGVLRVPAEALRRFRAMVAHYHGQIWNGAEPARALGVSGPTARSYLDLLTDAPVVRRLQPRHADLKKRQVKSPKVYVRDSGLLHQLLGLESEKALLEHPKAGASWEGFVIEQVLATEPHDEAWFWATHQGAEIDLILRRGDRLLGVECRRADAPKLTPSIRIAMDDLGLERVAVVYPGTRRYAVDERVDVVPLTALAERGGLFGDG